jgi:hypothetical protein
VKYSHSKFDKYDSKVLDDIVLVELLTFLGVYISLFLIYKKKNVPETGPNGGGVVPYDRGQGRSLKHCFLIKSG